MNRRSVLCILTLVCASSLHGQEAQRGGTTEVRQRPPGGAIVQRPPESSQQPASEATVSPELLGRIGFPVAPRPAAEVARPLAQIADVGVLSAAAQTNTPAVTVDLDAVRNRAGDVRDIRVVGEDGQTTTAAATSRAALLRRGELMVVRRPPAAVDPSPVPGDTPAPMPVPGPEPAPVSADSVAASPTILYTLDEAGRTRELGLVHRSAGLHWQSDTGRFTGELLVGILDRENPLASEPLGTTIPIQLLAAPGSLQLTDLQLDRIGSPFARVPVDVALPGNPFPVEFVSQIDPDLPPARLQVFRPRLSLSTPASIQGFGVEEAVVTISPLNTTLARGQSITLELDNGWLADQTVVVGDNGTASTRIRSNWLGGGTLRVVAPNVYDAEPKTIGYSAPVPFIVATLAGGMLGGAVLVHMLRRKAPRKRQSYWRDWIIGVAIGAGATTMAYAGMKLPEWIPVPQTLVGEVAPFALSFVCAAAGTALIQSIVGSREGG